MDIVLLIAHGYFLVAIAYNIASQTWLDLFGRKFAPTEPTNGLLMMAVVYILFLLDGVVAQTPRLFLLVCFIAAIARFGVGRHVQNHDPLGYLSQTTRLAAIAINTVGVTILSVYVIAEVL